MGALRATPQPYNHSVAYIHNFPRLCLCPLPRVWQGGGNGLLSVWYSFSMHILVQGHSRMVLILHTCVPLAAGPVFTEVVEWQSARLACWEWMLYLKLFAPKSPCGGTTSCLSGSLTVWCSCCCLACRHMCCSMLCALQCTAPTLCTAAATAGHVARGEFV